ncbi:hypothetical protein KSS87_021430 [Heliosperma pusillum]|nr:hypothetical protein KSS87_016385 [Heliosperma pusillum]KAH9612577.1 hypothetical protein KSS87_010697 [Heliosperma pusillum]KAH9613064.1 hypothetical protein KSS87_020903 [Heliosperma pusillum]KAH9624505.1 hypothetical protein KSS87_021430 [Heliosperma pusillum]
MGQFGWWADDVKVGMDMIWGNYINGVWL